MTGLRKLGNAQADRAPRFAVLPFIAAAACSITRDCSFSAVNILESHNRLGRYSLEAVCPLSGQRKDRSGGTTWLSRRPKFWLGCPWPNLS